MTRRAWQPDPLAREPPAATWRRSQRGAQRAFGPGFALRAARVSTLMPRRASTAIASVRVCTRSALRIALTWTLTVPSDSVRSRQINLLGLPWTKSFEHVGLSRREAQGAGLDVDAVGGRHVGRVGGQIDAAVEHISNRIEELFGIRALRDESLRAGAERRQHRRPIVRRGEHGDGHARIVELEIGEKIEPSRAGQREVEQHQRDVRLVVEHFHGLGGIAGGQHGRCRRRAGAGVARERRRSAGDRRSREFSCAPPPVAVSLRRALSRRTAAIGEDSSANASALAPVGSYSRYQPFLPSAACCSASSLRSERRRASTTDA